MYSVIYAIIAFITALTAGVWIYRQNHSTDSLDYVPAIIAGCLWPMAIMLWIMSKSLDVFKDMCIEISKRIDEDEKKCLEKDANSKEP